MDWAKASSVARGGAGGARAPPSACEVCKIACFFVLLRPIFCEKWKIVPPIRKEPPSNVWTCEIGRKIALNFGEDLFFFFFGDHLILGRKNLWILDFGRKITLNFGEDLFFFFFFWRSPNFGRKKPLISGTVRLKFRTNRLKLIQGQSKFESRSFAHFSLFQNSPPLFQILATRLAKAMKNIAVLRYSEYCFCFAFLFVLDSKYKHKQRQPTRNKAYYYDKLGN